MHLVIYQEWQAESEQRGRQEEGRSLVTLLLNQKFGAISSSDPQGVTPSLTERIAALSLEQLEALAITRRGTCFANCAPQFFSNHRFRSLAKFKQLENICLSLIPPREAERSSRSSL
ncbi:DUF4351 domain-containing protein [Phormidesmis priestleyi]